MNFRKTLKRYLKRWKRFLPIAVAGLMIGALLAGAIVLMIEERKTEKAIADVTGKLLEESERKIKALQKKLTKESVETEEETAPLPWNLVLVNYENLMEDGYVPELAELEPGYKVDARIADAAKQMLADAKSEGLRIVMCSAYRSVERQEELFNKSIETYLEQGLSYWEAFETTRLSIAEPKTSEHALGLALDLISYEYDELDEGQEETKEAKWLAENCYKYGFILRYPPAKTDITRIIYEPWHYRYVGVEDATKIKELGVTLEEYLEYYY